ncbi:MAG: 16S rRNA (guanine(527)-N(7))-methyltransferase RsmG [Clostridia bacterium]|nr:16S rRNA (guanine(527)-N(7))-methyltransferase RsmG [Clostridia bacterium]
MKEELTKKIFSYLIEENKKYNLTTITDYNDFLVKHIKDSELGLEYVYGKVLDIGSGAGFPGIVLKLEKEDIDITLIDSVKKKVDYINGLIKELNIKNAKAIHARIEDLDEKEKYDVVTARAVAPLRVLLEYALPFLKKGGIFVAYKSENIEEEIEEAKNALKILGGKIKRIDEKKLDEKTIRKFVIIEKVKNTEKKYPRKNNKPRKDPL